MTNEERNLLIIAAASLTACVTGGIWYVKIMRTERKKRLKIAEWELENLTLIRQSRDRVLEALANPNVTLTEAMQLWREENQFIDIMTNRPMY